MAEQHLNDIWSIGHSNIAIEKFEALILKHELELIIDVRSAPYSKYAPHFNSEILNKSLRNIGVDYRFMGDSLGGRPPELDLYDSDGHVLYNLLAENFRFRQGLEELCVLSNDKKLAMMCSEESPEHCHRRLLIGQVLLSQNIDIRHIHGSGEVSLDSTLREHFGDNQMELFEGKPWRSTQPVLRHGRLNNFSES